MRPILAIPVLLLVLYFLLTKKYKGLFVILITSILYTDFYVRIIGTSKFTIHAITVFAIFPFIFPFYKKMLLSKGFNVVRLFSIEFILLLLLAVNFAWINPFQDIAIHERSFNTSLEGRALLGSMRIFSDLLVCFFIVFLFKTKKITLSFFKKTLIIVALVQLVVGWIDYSLGYPLKDILFYAYKTSRPNGFCHEPKALGRMTYGAFILFFSFYLSNKDRSFKNLLICLTLLAGAFFTFSASTIGAGIITLGILILVNLNFRNLMSTVGLIVLLLIIGFSVSQTRLFKNTTKLRLERVAKGVVQDKIFGEPIIFTRFEQGDRVTLNFYYNEPHYLWFGTGPNLISIPGSKYTSKWMKDAYGKAFTLLPRIGILYFVARSGILGLFLMILMYLKLRKRILKKKNSKEMIVLLNGIFIFSNFIFTIWFYVYVGLIYVLTSSEPIQTKSILSEKN